MNKFGLPQRKRSSNSTLIWAGILGLFIGVIFWILVFLFFSLGG